jgi:hypothetical protein
MCSSYSHLSGDLFKQDANLIYDHFLYLRREESAKVLVERFYRLLIDGVEYPDRAVAAARDRIVTADSRWAAHEFLNVINRCCYILVNHWWLQSEFKADFKQSTVDLIGLFETTAVNPAKTLATRQLRELVHRFTDSPQYEALRRRAKVAGSDAGVATRQESDSQGEPIGNLIHRYPFLYGHYLQTDEDSSDVGHYAIRRLQAQREKQFEHDLLWYATHLNLQENNHAHRSVENPTLLQPDQLKVAIRQFAGKAEGAHSYRDLAFGFLREASQVKSYQALKWELQDYLTTAIKHSANPKYGSHRFNDWLHEELGNTLPHNDHLKPNGVLLVKTCGQLLDSFVNPNHPSNHGMFVDLIGNLGATFTVGLLLKLVLLCRRVKANLEAIKSHVNKRFAMMFKHYETRSRSEIAWLIECLDNVMVAFTIHFGQAGVHKWANLL